MNKMLLVFLAMALVFCLGATQQAAESTSSEKTKEGKPSVTKSAVVTVTATVQAIDLKKRLVTLKDNDGNKFEVLVGKEARNLPQVKVGDIVEVAYYESVAVKVYKPGEAPMGAEGAEILARAKPGEKPGGLAARQETVTATVQSIDKKKQVVVLEGPEGKMVKVNVKNPNNLVNVNVGDEVVITYTRAYAISVEKPKKK